ncbi:MAG: HAD family hydrolase [Elusimicrobiota bacterium]|jgi:D-glycero-D-manno-heptose 1,7-bisphosphate phosphatase|nr:HAD family hydrolase [Elusimicrobiota bacterium]
MNKAIFMDRDGTVIKEKPGTYLCKPQKVELYKNTLKALRIFKKKGYKLFIVSNQSAIGRGYFGKEVVKAVNDKILKLLKPAADIDDIAYCPHAPQANCSCRKPAPQMGLKLIKKYNINPEKSFMIGDKKSDIDFGRNIGAKAILVLTANGRKQKAKYGKNLKADKITSNLYSAAKYIQKQSL